MQRADGLLLHRLLRLARDAGRAILEVYDTDFGVTYKNDRSPLTLADRRAHELIFDQLGGLSLSACGSRAGVPVLSEEGGHVPYHERKGWDFFWLVDPLDGTREFIKRNGEFTVNIALIHGGRPVVGVVYIPVKGLFYYAMEGIGSYKLAGGEAAVESPSMDDLLRRSLKLPLNQPDRRDRPDGLTIVGSRSHKTRELEDYLEVLKSRCGKVEFIPAGSSLKFCLVAEGNADIYPRFGPTMEWDTAAGQALVEQAGGRLIAIDSGVSMGYNKRELVNPGFIAAREGITPYLKPLTPQNQ